ncbi:MAG TPA: hypothetical protein VGD22_04015 [Sphingobacteriaceae bacterium]
MPRKTASAIKTWIKSMGFELVKSHVLNRKNTRINYYSLGNFGIYEEIFKKSPSSKIGNVKRKFISWTPWGIDFEVSSVKDLMRAYEESEEYNPDLVIQ